MTTDAGAVGSMTVVCGLPGVGKSTVAPMVAEALDAKHLRTDGVRTELFDDPQYDRPESDITYRTLFDRARRHLREGHDVVLDGTFSDRARRESAEDAAETVGASFRIVKVHTDEEVVRERIADRPARPKGADFAIHLEKKASFDELPADVAVIDNSGAKATTRDRIEAWVENT